MAFNFCSTPSCLSLDDRWRTWIREESCRRLLSSCFMFDVHQSFSHAQQVVPDRWKDIDNVLMQPCPQSLWEATNAGAWYLLHTNHPHHRTPSDLALQDAVNVALLSTRLPIQPTFVSDDVFCPTTSQHHASTIADRHSANQLAQIHLALYHTPLRDLLAVSGDTWLFGKKITPKEFRESQERLRAWSQSRIACRAAFHASQFLLAALLDDDSFVNSFGSLLARSFGIFDYWSIYVTALICWVTGSQTLCTESMESTPSRIRTEISNRSATCYLRALCESSFMETRPDIDTSGLNSLIRLARERLELENFGNKSAMLVDAISVLKKILSAGRTLWF